MEIAAFDSKVESRLGVLDEVKGNLRVSLLLQVSNNALSNQVAASDDLQNLVIVLSDQSELESVLGRVDSDRLWLGRSIKAVNDLTLDSGKVDRLFECLDDTIVTAVLGHSRKDDKSDLPVWQSVLDVVQSGVDQDTAVIPCRRLDANGLVDQGALA